MAIMQSMLNERPNSQRQRGREIERKRERVRVRMKDRQKREEEKAGVMRKAVSCTVMCFSISLLIGGTPQREAELQQGLPQ